MSNEMEWREPAPPLRALVAAGWLSESDSRDPRIRIAVARSSHLVFRVAAPDGRAAVVKQMTREAAAQHRNLRAELFVYRLANWIPEVAQAIPHPVMIDEKHQILAVEAVGEPAAWPSAVADVP